MITVSAPAKLILFGEWSVLEPEGFGIATALSPRFRMQIIPDATKNFQFVSNSDPDVPPLKWKSGTEMPKGYFSFAARALKQLSGRTPLGGLYQFHRDWKLSEGLGSSSALLLCLEVGARLIRGERVPSPERLWQSALTTLRASQGRASGLDLAAQVFGGTVGLSHDKISNIDLKYPKELFLIHTGQKMSTASEVKKRNPEPKILKGLAASARDFLQHNDWVQSMHEHWDLLCELGVVPDEVQDTRDDWQKRGLIEAMKTTGAGGGDGLLCYSIKSAELRAVVAAKKWWISPHDWNSRAYEIG